MKKNANGRDGLHRLSEGMDKAVGARIRARRRMAGLTQGELAARLGLSYQQIQKYEAAANRISAGRLWVLAQVLEADVADFFKGEAEPAPRGEGRKVRRLALPTRALDRNVEAALVCLVQALSRRAR